MQEIWDLILNNFIGCLIVFARVTGIFMFNPILARATVPIRIRVAMSIVLTFIMLSVVESTQGIVQYVPDSMLSFGFILIMEAVLGYVFGLIVNMIITVIVYAGSIMDNQMTLSMAQMMDPSTGITMPISANMYYYLFVLYFFITGGHLTYIQLFADSYSIIPIGFNFSPEWLRMSHDLVLFLATVMKLGVKMSMPIIAAEMILQVCVGVIMKAVPTIQIFVINLQMKIIMGFLILMAIAGPMANYIDGLMDLMFQNLFGTLERLG